MDMSLVYTSRESNTAIFAVGRIEQNILKKVLVMEGFSHFLGPTLRTSTYKVLLQQ